MAFRDKPPAIAAGRITWENSGDESRGEDPACRLLAHVRGKSLGQALEQAAHAFL